MSELYPLRFQPLLRRYLWGGRRLESLGKSLPPGDDYAESWEVVDRGADQSVVSDGPLAGRTLHEIIVAHPRALLGKHAGVSRFPLLFKFLDAQRQLSIQVHPDDARAALVDPAEVGKTEAWVVLAAEPASYLYAGLHAGVDHAALRSAIDQGHCEELLARLEPRAGDCFFLPAGVVHALGPGLLVAEIQQSSDTTYRLYDWNRLGPDGKPRPLHVEQALAATDFTHGPVRPQQPQVTGTAGRQRLVACAAFVLERWQGDRTPTTIGGDQRFHIITVLEGAADLACEGRRDELVRGSVLLLPAELSVAELHPREPTTILDAYLP